MKNKALRKEGRVFDIINIGFLGLLALASLFPFYSVVIQSFAKYEVIISHRVYLLPISFDLSAYKMIFSEKKFLTSASISVFVTTVGTAFNMFLSVNGAYALSKKDLPGRNIILGAVLFTLLFNGGLIPYYLVVKGIGLVNSIFVMILPAGINTIYLIIMKNYFSSMPQSLEESAKIDGANDFYILYKIIIPISAPFIATFVLFYSVERWNEWWNALIFINQSSKAPLQIYLREILLNFSDQIGTLAATMREQRTKVYMTGMQMAAIVVSSVPIILVYPSLQKHFVQGIMIGAVKG